jgi:hypothetical protein
MIQMPRRSVTRFFIPLIDVLTLLFAIFLLMPMFEEEARTQEENQPTAPNELRKELESAQQISGLKRLLDESRRTAERLRKEQNPVTAREREEMNRLQDQVRRLQNEARKPLQERYAIFVLGLDARSGDLFYYDPLEASKKVVLKKPADARKLIEQQRALAGDRDLYFLFQAPRKKSRFPIGSQRKMYETWFRGVPHGYESPGGRP